MSVLLTGGAGFVGLNTALQLLKDGEDVVTFGLEAPPERFLAEIVSLPGHLSVEIGDVRDRDAVLRAMSDHSVDRLVHGAAVTAGRQREISSPGEIASVNLGGTIEVLEAAVTHGVRRVVQLGSGSVYGADADISGTLDEVANRPVPDSLYGITKYAAERTGLRYRETRDLDLVVARIGVVFGRWEYATGKRDTLSVPFQLLQIAARGDHARFVSDLPDDWVYAEDVATAVVGLLNTPSLDHEVFHVGTGERWSVTEWCSELCSEFPEFSFEIVPEVALANVGRMTPNRRAPFSIERLRRQLGFEPQYLRSDAMADYVSWWNDSGKR